MLIVGLGNPGKEYENTFHNMGYLTLDAVAEKLNKRVKKIECSSLISVSEANGEKLVLAKPITYMNNSGLAVKSLMKKYAVPLEKVLIIYDDIDIPRYSVRVREHGSAGTHNGMRSIVSELNCDVFKRVRMGIGRGEYDLKDYVLSQITPRDMEEFKSRIDKVADLIVDYIKSGDFDRLMREGNVIK